jgi:hypothetical protein
MATCNSGYDGRRAYFVASQEILRVSWNQRLALTCPVRLSIAFCSLVVDLRQCQSDETTGGDARFAEERAGAEREAAGGTGRRKTGVPAIARKRLFSTAGTVIDSYQANSSRLKPSS